ncbi:MAG: LysR family transcriptional regulator, partial [Hyphomonadaceae bacterium]
IHELERRLGFSLFARTSRRVELTAKGALFLDWARRLIIETDWINQAARDIRSNQLRSGAAHHSGLIAARRALIEHFILAYPATPMKITGGSPAQLYAELSRQEIDIAIALEPDAQTAGVSAVESGVSDEFERLVLASKPMTLLAPREHEWAKRNIIRAGALRGQRVMTINRAHGVALSEAVARQLSAAGAEIVHPPEGDAPSVARYGALLRTPAVSFGWFNTHDETMIERPAADLDLKTNLSLIRSRRPQRPGALAFWAAAEAIVERKAVGAATEFLPS